MSAETGHRLGTVCQIAGVSRSAAFELRRREQGGRRRRRPQRKRGPVGAMPDAELRTEIHHTIEDSPFNGEGHRKIWARLRRRGIRTSRKRALRLMREDGVLAPTPQVRKRAARLHTGTITVETPDTLWATDATEAWSDQDGRCAVFVIVDHGTGELFFDAAHRMDRFAAADLLREVTAERFGSVEAAVAAGLALRYDGGPCFRSDHYQTESTTSASPARPPSTTSQRPTGVRRGRFRRSRSRCCGSSASRPSRSCALRCVTSAGSTTASGCSSVTATAHRSRPGRCSSPRARGCQRASGAMIDLFNRVSGYPGAAHLVPREDLGEPASHRDASHVGVSLGTADNEPWVTVSIPFSGTSETASRSSRRCSS